MFNKSHPICMAPYQLASYLLAGHLFERGERCVPDTLTSHSLSERGFFFMGLGIMSPDPPD
jgi:hypothetical protein